ncbi:MAG TPA: MFS transporter [Planctomycetaceae bacterium]|nr:MFS transporter [Planctomycetaceae bacterium]
MTTASPPVPAAVPETGSVYNRNFWLAYLANVSLVSANALTFRFAEFISFLGGTEHIAGTVVGAGVAGALVARLLMGQGIDHYGTRRLWLGGGIVFLLACGTFTAIAAGWNPGGSGPRGSQVTWPIYAARVAFSVSIATMFTCSIVHIQNLVPAGRRTEVIGNLGSSGFIGMVAGAQAGDLIFRLLPAGRPQFLALFGGTAALGVVYFVLVRLITRNDNHVRPSSTPPAHRLLLRYWPGAVLLVAVMMGIGFAVTTVFLTRFATQLGAKNGVGTFFTAYALSAFLFRVSARNWSRTIGRHKMILLGLAGHFVGFALLTLVRTEWHFLFPALASGFGHALLFPAVVSLGSGAFPKEYRGSGTTLVLGFLDLGTALSAPILGGVIDSFGGTGFVEMFWLAAGAAAVIGVFYAMTAARRPDEDVLRARAEAAAAAVPVVFRDVTAVPDPADEPVAVPFPHVGRSA